LDLVFFFLDSNIILFIWQDQVKSQENFHDSAP